MASTEFRGNSDVAEANEAVTQFTFGHLETTGKLSMADAGERCDGIISDTVASGRSAAYFYDGDGYLTVDGSGTAIAIGDRLKSTTDGVGLKSEADLDEIGAIALQASTASGDIIRVKILGAMERSIA